MVKKRIRSYVTELTFARVYARKLKNEIAYVLRHKKKTKKDVTARQRLSAPAYEKV